MTAEAVESGKLDIGRVISGTLQVIGRNLVSFSVLGLLLSGLPTAVISIIQLTAFRGQTEAMAAGSFNMSPAYFTSMGMGVLAALITTAILQGALIYGTVQDLNGQRPSIGAALATGLRSFLPLLILTVLLVLAIACGMVALLVPGIMMACAWCVAVPALVAERTGVFGAFGRSADLTRNNRWRIFGLFVLVWVILLVIGLVFGALTGITAVAGAASGADPVAVALNPVNIVISVIQQTISAVIGAAFAAVLYVELRKARDGAGPQWLAEIFS